MIWTKSRNLLLALLLLSALRSTAQIGSNICPPNIGFEMGDFSNWECFSGMVLSDGSLSLTATGPVMDVHTIYQNVGAVQNDFYGNFPMVCPNGSGYSIRLGNNDTRSAAERISYTFTIPQGQDNYSIVYSYAVVIENPNHAAFQQPKFTAQVFDVSSNEYINCASFEFIASPDLPGFELSTNAQNVYFKPWSPVTINLNGYAGKTVRLEFTNNDCTLGGHFGYAYLDIYENCASPVSGNSYCLGTDSVVLKAPFGFKEYRWYDQTMTTLLGTSNDLLISPAPAHNTIYALEVIPYPGLGCQDTLFTTINASPEVLELSVPDSIKACFNPGANLTAPSVTSGSSAGLTFSYYTDFAGNNFVPQPSSITTSGTYYIKAINASGCTDIKPIGVLIRPLPNLVVVPVASACGPGGVNLTLPAITAGSDPGLNFTYWTNSTATSPMTNPFSVTTSGTYYIKGANSLGCYDIKPVSLNTVSMVTNSINACASADLTHASVTQGSSAGFTFTYWQDAALSQPVNSPQAVTLSGTYYIRGEQVSGCSISRPVQVTVVPNPSFAVTNPAPVTYPETIDLRQVVNTAGLNFTYWTDAIATQPQARPDAIGVPGTYYIRGANASGCFLILPVTVNILPPPEVKIKAPNAFSPNGDGINDLFRIEVEGTMNIEKIKIFNRWGQMVYQTSALGRFWDGTANGKPLPFGTYYWVMEGVDPYRNKKVQGSGAISLLR
jgi:gliding motility-associated-like protein